jgi:hypothetical protein
MAAIFFAQAIYGANPENLHFNATVEEMTKQIISKDEYIELLSAEKFILEQRIDCLQ